MEDIYLLIKEEVDFHTIYGIYCDYLKADEDYHNLLKYQNIDKDDLHLYVLETNYFYKDEEFTKIY